MTITPQEIKVLFEGERRKNSRVLNMVWTEADRIARRQLIEEMEKRDDRNLTTRMKRYATLVALEHDEGEIGGDAFVNLGCEAPAIFTDLQAAVKLIEEITLELQYVYHKSSGTRRERIRPLLKASNELLGGV